MTRYFLYKNGVTVANLTNQDLIEQYLADDEWHEITEADYLTRQPKEVEPDKNSIRIGELKSKLAQSDYKLFKYMEGDLTREEYIPIMKQRKEWRAEINRLEGETEPSMAEPIM